MGWGRSPVRTLVCILDLKQGSMSTAGTCGPAQTSHCFSNMLIADLIGDSVLARVGEFASTEPVPEVRLQLVLKVQPVQYCPGQGEDHGR